MFFVNNGLSKTYPGPREQNYLADETLMSSDDGAELRIASVLNKQNDVLTADNNFTAMPRSDNMVDEDMREEDAMIKKMREEQDIMIEQLMHKLQELQNQEALQERGPLGNFDFSQVTMTEEERKMKQEQDKMIQELSEVLAELQVYQHQDTLQLSAYDEDTGEKVKEHQENIELLTEELREMDQSHGMFGSPAYIARIKALGEQQMLLHELQRQFQRNQELMEQAVQQQQHYSALPDIDTFFAQQQQITSPQLERFEPPSPEIISEPSQAEAEDQQPLPQQEQPPPPMPEQQQEQPPP
eukprot:CAMPEP_0195512714 /NCGR_PEP_ID=MMETSP0794_2-20130614/4582_1 /TAXON_ID=515487 /ORGANISM="Stephanopyxis turris, Strain CCMP 815" /LENGTH=298 /DNA_ID=CAMNT_0040640563 /DNA_START=262 /DNA_END=1154 /DNA_ORIENTATION=+